MEHFRSRPKGDYIAAVKWPELYSLTEHWKSDLLFYKDDLKFLRHLVDKYFMWIKDQDNLEGVRLVGEAILKATRECDELLNKTTEHLSLLVGIIDGSKNYDSKKFRTAHAELEEEIARFIKSVREHRKHLFTITEYVMDSENLNHHLKS